MMLIEQSIEQFITELASASPAPGGGSAAALAGALGAALCGMVCRLSQGDAFQEQAAEIADIAQCAAVVQSALTRYIDEDAAAFQAVMTAFKLPKATEDAKRWRSEQIQAALLGAARLPLAVAGECLKIQELAERALRCGNRNAASDAAVAGLLAYAALRGASYNVSINLTSLKDENMRQCLQAEVTRLTTAAEGYKRSLDGAVASYIG